MKETLEDYKARSNLYMYLLNCLLILFCRSPLLLDVTKVTYGSLPTINPEEIEARARQALDEQAQYNLMFNNCEHFVTWCVYGKKISDNVATGVAVTATTATGGTVGVVAGRAIGTAFVPGVGTIVGGLIGGVGGAVAGLVSGATTWSITMKIVDS